MDCRWRQVWETEGRSGLTRGPTSKQGAFQPRPFLSSLSFRQEWFLGGRQLKCLYWYPQNLFGATDIEELRGREPISAHGERSASREKASKQDHVWVIPYSSTSYTPTTLNPAINPSTILQHLAVRQTQLHKVVPRPSLEPR